VRDLGYECVMTMSAWLKVWAPSVALVLIVGIIWILSWWGGQPSLRPSDMPRDSVWIHAPNLPFEWHRGWWFGCWIDSDGHSDRCRLWSAELTDPIEYEGRYFSCENNSPVPLSELKLKAPQDSSQMWVRGDSGQSTAPAAFLQNGNVLVPLEGLQSCEQLKKLVERKH
jgi:hypothetical protein